MKHTHTIKLSTGKEIVLTDEEYQEMLKSKPINCPIITLTMPYPYIPRAWFNTITGNVYTEDDTQPSKDD